MTSPDTGRFTQKEIDLAKDVIDTLAKELGDGLESVALGIADVCILVTAEMLLHLKKEGWEEVLTSMVGDTLAVAGALSEIKGALDGKGSDDEGVE